MLALGCTTRPPGRGGEQPGRSPSRLSPLANRADRVKQASDEALSGSVSMPTRSFLSMLQYFKSLFHSEFRLRRHRLEYSRRDRYVRKAARALSMRRAGSQP